MVVLHDLSKPRSRFRYWFHHPTTRLLNVIITSGLSCVLFSKDPIGYSPAEAQIPILGPAGKFLFYPYPFLDTLELVFKTLLAIVYLIAGMIFGKYIIHNFLFRDRFKWAMFNEDKGSWFCMLITSIWSLYTGCFLFNLIDKLYHPHVADQDHEEIGDGLGFTFAKFHEFLNPFSLTFSIFVFIMVFDDILQDRTDAARSSIEDGSSIGHFSIDPYPNTWKMLKRIYRSGHGAVRMLLFWAVMIMIFIFHGIVLEYERLEHTWIHSNLVPVMSEFERSFLASIIASLELLSIMQDEEFPRFCAVHRVRLVGFNSSRIHFALKNFQIVVTGKWFNYSFVLWAIGTDLIMFYYQFTYKPELYHQSIDDDGFIIYSGGVLDKSTYEDVKPYLMWLTVTPMFLVSMMFIFSLISDAKSKRREKSLRIVGDGHEADESKLTQVMDA